MLLCVRGVSGSEKQPRPTTGKTRVSFSIIFQPGRETTGPVRWQKSRVQINTFLIPLSRPSRTRNVVNV